MCYYKKSFYKNNIMTKKLSQIIKANIIKENYYRSRSGSRDNNYFSKKEYNMFNMYYKNQHLLSSSSESSYSNNDDEFFVNRE